MRINECLRKVANNLVIYHAIFFGSWTHTWHKPIRKFNTKHNACFSKFLLFLNCMSTSYPFTFLLHRPLHFCFWYSHNCRETHFASFLREIATTSIWQAFVTSVTRELIQLIAIPFSLSLSLTYPPYTFYILYLLVVLHI